MAKKKQKNKGFRDGVSKEDILKDLTKEDWERLAEQKRFQELDPESIGYKVAVYSDGLRAQVRERKEKIRKRLWNIKNLQNNVTRLQVQLRKGNITEELKPGVLMNEAEVKSQIQHNKWVMEGEARDVPKILAEIRGIVGTRDVAKNVVISEEEFEEYAGEVLDELEKLGFKPLNEVA